MQSLQIDTNITFCPNTLVVSQPLSISNTSQDQLAFKIKTNQKNLLSMYINHGFIKPFSTMSIPVKIVQKVDDSVSIKLQVNWCKVTGDMKQKNDSKMTSVSKELIYKKVFPIHRKAQNQLQNASKSSFSGQKNTSVFDSVYSSGSVQKQQKDISPFQYQNSQKTYKQQAKPSEYGYKSQIIQKTQQRKKQQSTNRQLGYSSIKKSDSVIQSYEQSGNSRFLEDTINLSGGLKNLQIVSEEDQDDHEKQLQQIRNQQIQQKRKTDQIKVKIRKLNTSIKSKQLISPPLLAAAVLSSFLFGSFLQYLIF